jgi:hypothetical protein
VTTTAIAGAELAGVAELERITAVCDLVRDYPLPRVCSTGATCSGCRRNVWVPLATIECLAELGRIADAQVACFDCARRNAGSASVVLAWAGDTAAAAEAARECGVPAGTPVLDLRRRHRA